MTLTEHRHMRNSRYSQHPRHRFTTLVALALILPSLTACWPTGDPQNESGKPVLSSVSAEEAKAIKIDDSHPGYVSPLPTKSGPLHLDTTCDMDAPSALVKHDTQGDIVWAKKITPRISGVCTDETMTPQGAADYLLFTPTSGYAVVSPNTHYASFPAVSLPFAVHIGKAEDDIGKAVSFLIEADIILTGHFRQSVKRYRAERLRFPHRKALRSNISVNSGRRRKNDPLHTVLPRRFQDIHRAFYIIFHIFLRILHRGRYHGLRRQMDNGIEVSIFHHVPGQRAFDITADEICIIRYIFQPAGGQVIQYGNCLGG